ncbi:MAG: prepilin-type N-terminal cleavage/methylation domain-containing protein [Phycisphaerae bacterium]
MRSARGFTFVEALATIALIAIVMPSVMSGITACLTAGESARQQAQAASLAHGKLMELVAGAQWQQATLGGDFGDQWPGFRWAAQISDWDGSKLVQLDVTVLWQARNKLRTLTLTTLVPAASAPTGSTSTGTTP